LATETWEKLRDGDALRISQGECTITDHNLLEISRANLPSMKILKTPLRKEATTGTDWEWWIGSASAGWFRFAVQAKKLCIKTQSYSNLAHKINGRSQLEILSAYALANRAIPLYCLYNYVPNIINRKFWHCCQTEDSSQYGCTLAHLDTMKTAMSTTGNRKFAFVHSVPTTVPWRCILCNSSLPVLDGVTPAFSHALIPYSSIPGCLTDSIERNRTVRFDPQFYSASAEALPARILIVDTDMR
jgi:hypothetical protein